MLPAPCAAVSSTRCQSCGRGRSTAATRAPQRSSACSGPISAPAPSDGHRVVLAGAATPGWPSPCAPPRRPTARARRRRPRRRAGGAGRRRASRRPWKGSDSCVSAAPSPRTSAVPKSRAAGPEAQSGKAISSWSSSTRIRPRSDVQAVPGDRQGGLAGGQPGLDEPAEVHQVAGPPVGLVLGGPGARRVHRGAARRRPPPGPRRRCCAGRRPSAGRRHRAAVRCSSDHHRRRTDLAPHRIPRCPVRATPSVPPR